MKTTVGCKVYWAKVKFTLHLCTQFFFYNIHLFNCRYLYCYYLLIHIYLNLPQIRFNEHRSIRLCMPPIIDIHSWGTWHTPCPLHLKDLPSQMAQNTIQTLHFNWFCRVPLTVRVLWPSWTFGMPWIFMWKLQYYEPCIQYRYMHHSWRSSSRNGIKKEVYE